MIKCIAPWFGSKRSLAPRIVEQLGPHDHFHEPFCGSLAVLFAKEKSRQETVNDLHGDLINLTRVVQDDDLAPQLFERLACTLFSDGLFDTAKEIMQGSFGDPLEPPVMIERAYAYFVVSWMGRNGIAGTNVGHLRGASYSIAVRWTNGGGSPTVRFRNVVESIPAWHERLRNVVILHRDAFSYLHKLEDVPGTAIYVDPPYASESRSGFNSGGGKSHYLHEFKQSEGALLGAQDDHVRLAEILRRYQQARIIVSYYDCPRVRELYAGWTFLDCMTNKKLTSANGRGGGTREAPELLIINGPARAGSAAPTEPAEEEATA